MKFVNRIYDLAEERCYKCPAFWSHRDYYGEYDEGCILHNDIYDFCRMSLLPRWWMKLLADMQKRRGDRAIDGSMLGLKVLMLG